MLRRCAFLAAVEIVFVQMMAGAAEKNQWSIEPPVLSCIPDIVIGDADGNTLTQDSNLFEFPNAFEFDEYVEDPDTPDALIRWSFIDPRGSISINGIFGGDPGVNTLEPGASDLRSVSPSASFRNTEWQGTDPGDQAITETSIIFYASDGTTVTHQWVIVTTINDGEPDSLVIPPLVSHSFDAGTEGWEWFDIGSVFTAPEHAWSGGSLTMTEPPGQSDIVFGSWESPKDPAVAPRPRLGCVTRARYHVRSSVEGASCPGYRMRAITTHVMDDGGRWVPDFRHDDYNAYVTANYFSLDALHVFGREAGVEGQVYEVLYFPRQVPVSLNAPNTIAFFTFDLLDLDAEFTSDSGTLYLDALEIDAFDRPDLGKGRPEPALSFTDFSTGWTANVYPIDAAFDNTGLVIGNGVDIHVTVAPGNQWFDAVSAGPAVALEPGRYYRAAFWVTSTEVPGGDIGPTTRAGFASSRYVWSVDMDLAGGSLLVRLTSTPSLCEVWMVAPSEADGTGLTEPIQLRFGSWLAANEPMWPFYRVVSGTISCIEVVTESFEAP